MTRKLTILYGSQTGCAQDLAEQIYRESKLYHFVGKVIAMDDYNVKELINESLVVFVCSTTGQGTEPDNMKMFWKFLLRKNLANNSLSNLSYAVIGLGDSSYSKYNFVAKRLNRRLQQLGANEIIPIGLCDEQHDLGISATSVSWLATLWEKLLVIKPMPNSLRKLSTVPLQTKWTVEIVHDIEYNSCQISRNVELFDYSIETSFSKPFVGEVIVNERTTSMDHFQDVRLLGFKPIKGEWFPGDVVVIRPKNPRENVEQLFQIFNEHNLKLYPETVVSVKQIDSEMPVPSYLSRPHTLETIVTQLWDLSAIPRPRTFEILAINCTNELEKEKCFEFTMPEGQQDLYSYANRPKRTILEVLQDFPHSTSKLTLDLLFELFRPIQTRQFSIASCQATNRLDILVAVVNYKTILQTPRKGLCSNWLKELQIGDVIYGSVKRGAFKLPPDEQPLIMIGPGTGVAPFRSILQQKHLTWNKQQFYTLFFGCRSESKDFHCRSDFENMENIELLKLFVAFSRDQEDKVYVQHKIAEQSALIKELIKTQNGWILLAGNSKNMPQDVKDSLITILDNDSEYVEKMIKCGRYQEETWA